MTEILTEPVTRPSVWRSADFTGEGEWVVALTPEEVGELDAALTAARNRELPLSAVTFTDFPLAT